jgi:hypothetical protein
MKQSLLILALIFIFLISKAQTRSDVKIYGYIQPVSRGVAPDTNIDEAGNVKPKSVKPGSNYFIYITGPASTRIYPVEMWVKGKQYSAKSETVYKTPVQLADPAMPDGPNLITLVPKTTKKVMMLVPGNFVNQGKSLAIAKSKAKTNELVVVYKMNGKFHYALLEKLNIIERASMQ